MNHNLTRFCLILAAGLTMAACTPPERIVVTSAEPGQLASETKTEVKHDRAPTDASDIILTREDITDRAYKAIADIKVVVRRLFLPDPDPKQEEADNAMKKAAASYGADAVVLMRYGSSGITLNTWGTLEAQGRAVYFVE